MLHTETIEDISDLEEQVAAQGQRLLSAAEKHIESDRKSNPWLDRFLDRIMEDETFRVQALRFVDVILQLDNDQDLIKHFDEYFSEYDLPLTGLIKFGLRYSKSGLASVLIGRIRCITNQCTLAIHELHHGLFNVIFRNKNWSSLCLPAHSRNAIKCSINRIINSFCAGRLSATSNAKATSILSLIICSTGLASRC